MDPVVAGGAVVTGGVDKLFRLGSEICGKGKVGWRTTVLGEIRSELEEAAGVLKGFGTKSSCLSERRSSCGLFRGVVFGVVLFFLD